jgi:hypothetical protein
MAKTPIVPTSPFNEYRNFRSPLMVTSRFAPPAGLDAIGVSVPPLPIVNLAIFDVPAFEA